MDRRRVERKPARRPSFSRRYTAADIALLAEADAAHEDLSGPAMRHLLRRELEVYGDERFQRLAGISASHIYNLRHSADYGKLRVRVRHTQARQVAIGERRPPNPKGKPGYLRVDTVHQGQHDGAAPALMPAPEAPGNPASARVSGLQEACSPLLCRVTPNGERTTGTGKLEQ